MAWMASNIYVRSEDPAAVAGLLEARLGDPRACIDREGILDVPEPMVVSPPEGGWVAVIRAGAWLQDLPGVAEELARELGRQALSLELVANCYRLRLRAFLPGGATGEGIQLPAEGWTDDRLAEPEPAEMPLYEDTEALAYGFLRDQGVPPRLVVLGAVPLGFDEADRAPIGPGLALSHTAEGELCRRELEVHGVPYASEDPPSLPTNISRDFGLMLFEERYVEGRPAQATLERLLEIEEQLLARARRAHRGPGPEITLTVTYCDPLHQDRLDALLRERDRHAAPAAGRSAPPWWQFWRYFGLRRR